PSWSCLVNSFPSPFLCRSHSLVVLSTLVVANHRPSGLNTTRCTAPSWPVSVSFNLQVFVSQTFTVLSQLPVASSEPSFEKVAQATLLLCPRRVRRASSTSTFH